jgi:hypothetical protein
MESLLFVDAASSSVYTVSTDRETVYCHWNMIRNYL